MPGGADRDLRHFERDAIIACGSMATVALVVSRGVAAPLGVLAGGLLMALSYLAVKGGVDALVGPRGGGPLTLRQRVLGAVKFLTRYALLAIAAYAMLSCFRLHPIGLVAGAASPFIAAIAQVVRISRSPV